MKVTVAAYKLLLEIAQAHEGLEREEIKLLKRYRRALGIPKDELLRETVTPLTERMIEGSVREREEALLAMARVALADGRLSPVERERIVEVAERLGVGRMQVAHLLHQAEEELEQQGAARSREPRKFWFGIGAVLVAGLAILALMRPRNEADLRRFAAVHDRALVLVRVEYEMVKGTDTRSLEGTGSGFFVDAEGRLVTCKHVVQPWKFLAEPVRLAATGFRLDPDSVRWTAWRVGARVRGPRGGLAFGEAYDSRAKTLELVATAEDSWVMSTRTLPTGAKFKGRYHALDNNDLAVLRAQVGEPVPFIPMAESASHCAPLDPLVVLGFPRGLDLIEGTAAVSSPSVGFVRKTEETILISTPIFPGNSGGPALGAAGEVVGVAARRAMGEEELGRCIRVSHVRALLGG
ncbi:MAG: hypothetical protein GY711_05310 [bacterium]|nr:hypothetical protein [bacterium]